MGHNEATGDRPCNELVWRGHKRPALRRDHGEAVADWQRNGSGGVVANS